MPYPSLTSAPLPPSAPLYVVFVPLFPMLSVPLGTVRLPLPVRPPNVALGVVELKLIAPPPEEFTVESCRASALATVSVPELTVVGPLKVFVPERVSLPLPVLVSPPSATVRFGSCKRAWPMVSE